MYKEEREMRPRCLISGKCFMTESRGSGNCFVVVYCFDSHGPKPVPMNPSSIFLHACVFISEVCVSVTVRTVIFTRAAQECLRHLTQFSQSPGREEVALFASESEFCAGVDRELLRELWSSLSS